MELHIASLLKVWKRSFFESLENQSGIALKYLSITIRDAKLRPSSPPGLKIQAQLVFLRSPNQGYQAHAGLGKSSRNVLRIDCRASCGAQKMLIQISSRAPLAVTPIDLASPVRLKLGSVHQVFERSRGAVLGPLLRKSQPAGPGFVAWMEGLCALLAVLACLLFRGVVWSPSDANSV